MIYNEFGSIARKIVLFNFIVYSLDDGFIERACWIFSLLLVEVSIIIELRVSFFLIQIFSPNNDTSSFICRFYNNVISKFEVLQCL